MKNLKLTVAMIFLLASITSAQDPDYAITVGTVYADSGITDFLVPIYLTAPDSICLLHIPLSWQSIDNGIRAVDAGLVNPFYCDGFSDSVHVDEHFVDLLVWCTPPYLIWPAFHQLFINIRFIIDSNASPQIVALDTTYSQRNGSLMFGACNGIDEIYPTFTPGYIYYGMPNSAEEESPLAPAEFTLDQNYPNPFAPKTYISLENRVGQTLRLEIYNICGQLVDVLVDDYLYTGHYTVNWDGNDSNGSNVPSGIYYYRLSNGRNTIIRKFTLLK